MYFLASLVFVYDKKRSQMTERQKMGLENVGGSKPKPFSFSGFCVFG